MTGAQASDPVGRDLLFTFAQRVAELERLAPAGVAIAGVVVYATGSEDVLDGLGAEFAPSSTATSPTRSTSSGR